MIRRRIQQGIEASSELNLLHLPFFRKGKDPLEDFDYNAPDATHSYDPQPQELLVTPLHTSMQAASWQRCNDWSPSVLEFIPFIIYWCLWIARNDAKHHGSRLMAVGVQTQVNLPSRFGWALLFVHKASTSGHCALDPAPTIIINLTLIGNSARNPGASSVDGVVRESAGCTILSFSEIMGVGTNIRSEIRAILWVYPYMYGPSYFLSLD
ncbi:F-box/FBD/LRR-repeat protein [Dorcoceras hygrometricum]|uniref:F-box/FBD/LRR-repeat protein n=1 Tax=Dorcoceras hygrometricum TaxID=472368 RepID=A0A2Z7A359_9LAMI|nr:F-box/FBD/LRR-repeat protein [Dorcoceras hygrometricum]